MHTRCVVVSSPRVTSAHDLPQDLHHRKRFMSVRKFTEFRSCVKIEVAVLGSPSLIVLMVSVDVKQH